MFTGLISEMGIVEACERTDDGARISFAARETAHELEVGDSVAVNGVCLTAVNVGDGKFSVEAMNQTLSASGLDEAGEGDRVNLELPLRASDRVGGHFVQGHVDGVGSVLSVEPDGFARRIKVTADSKIMGCLADRGSVAVNGVSLTVSDIDENSFEVSLIPETLQKTNLGDLKPENTVNVEVDMLAKYVSRIMDGKR